jgi:hypothetical protein
LFPGRGRAGLTIADLTVVRDAAGNAVEVVVSFMCEGTDSHRDTLCRWAAFAGYRRVWFDDDVVELEPNPGGRAQTRCSGCSVHLVDGKNQFWDYVRRLGAFPTGCPLCGSDLPQWTRLSERSGTPRVRARRLDGEAGRARRDARHEDHRS